MHYPCSENKGADHSDQLRSYCEADLRLCFRNMQNQILEMSNQQILNATGFYSCQVLKPLMHFEIFDLHLWFVLREHVLPC